MTYEDAINWIKTAQDITPDGGVSAFFASNVKVWQSSYPETSGYIIPTLIEADEIYRARRISLWLRQIQLENGAIPQGYWTSNTPNAFDTAQVLRGWLAMEEVSPDPRTLESIDRAMGFLEDYWRLHQWDERQEARTFHVRNVAPMQQYGSDITSELLEFFADRLTPNGWPTKCEDNQKYPLTHFIVYVARGFSDAGDETIPRVIMTQLAHVIDEHGKLPSRLDKDWRPKDDSICNPGVAQAAIMFHRLGMKDHYHKCMDYISTLDAPWASNPIDSEYLANSQVNWCAKFIADAYAIAHSNT